MVSKKPQHMASRKSAAAARLKKPQGERAQANDGRVVDKIAHRIALPSASRMVAVAASVAAVGAFGVGAFELAQGGLSFDPSSYIATYAHGDAASGEAYRISSTSTDAEANRHDEQSDSSETSAREQEASLADVPTQASLSGQSGTTAYNVTGNANGSGVTIAGGAGNNGTSGGASAGGVLGPVINPGGGAGGNGAGGGGANSGGAGGGGSNNSTANSYKYLVRDPVSEKNSPGAFFMQFNGNTGVVDPDKVTITPADDVIYDGQMLDAWTLFCAMDVHWGENFNELYYLACTKDEFATFPYFRINSWTNAAGEQNPTLCSDQPVTVSVSLRLSQDAAWTTRSVTIQPAPSCLFVVGQPDSLGRRDVIWNSLGSEGSSSGRKKNLLSVNTQEALMKRAGHVDSDGYLNALLLGWRENDAYVPYFYTLTPGRHVVIPGDIVPIDSAYKVRFQSYTLDNDYSLSDEPSGPNNSRLQTLVDVDEAAVSVDGDVETLSVPQGVQAVDAYTDSRQREGFVWQVNNLELPSSVCYVNVNAGFQVLDAYRVASDNPVYAATDDGILTSRDGKEYLGVPYDTRELDIPADVTDVVVPTHNKLDRIVLHASKEGELPQIDVSELRDCTLVVDDDVLLDFIVEHASELDDAYSVYLAPASNPKVQFMYSQGLVYSLDSQAESDLYCVLDTGSNIALVQISNNIMKGAFAGNTSVDTLVLMPWFGDEITLEDGCLAGGSVQTIVCATDEQATYVEQHKAAAGAPDARVIMMDLSQDGYLYYDNAGKTILLSAAGDEDGNLPSTFNGTLLTGDGKQLEVDAIAPYAFSGDTELTFVNLGESTREIGRNAFENCENLQGVFIGTPDSIEVDADAFKGCTGLGFVASRATKGVFATTENPNPAGCTWYAPDGETQGYDSRFVTINGIYDFGCDAQSDDVTLLYGYYTGDEEGKPSILLGAPSVLNGTISLLPSTVEIFGGYSSAGARDLPGAFEGTGGVWDIDWSSAPKLKYVDRYAFRNSGIAGDLNIDLPNNNIVVGVSAFDGCANLTSASLHAATLEVEDQAFMNCLRLTSASFVADRSGDFDAATGMGSQNYLASSVFGNDANFTSLTVGVDIATLGYPSPGVGFFFDGSTDFDEEASRIRLSVPAGMEQDYLNAWVYGFIGYDDYDTYYGEVEWGMLFDYFMGEGPEPTTEAVRDKMAENLLEPENRLRTMMGLPLVEASTVIKTDDDASESDEWKIEDNGDGTFALVSAPSDIEDADLASILTGPTVIEASAFSRCSQLKTIELCDKVIGIQSNAFAGCNGVTVTLPAGCPLPELLGGMESMPFSFGGNVALDVADADREALLKTWSRQMVGAFTDDEESDYVWSKWFSNVDMDTFMSPTFDVLNKAVNEPIMECENRLRAMMGMEAVGDINELANPIDLNKYPDCWIDE